MKQVNSVIDFEVGQVFLTKKGHKIEVLSIHRDTNVGDEIDNGSVCIKAYVHRDSENSKSYGWGHNNKYFISVLRVDGKEGLIRKLQIENWELRE